MLVMVGAQVTREMHFIQVFEECHIVEEKLFTKIAVWMWQYLTMSIVSKVTLLNVCPQRINVI